MKYKGAVSDTDILINLAKGDCINLLEFLFDEIIIPKYIIDVELRKKSGVNYTKIVQAKMRTAYFVNFFKKKLLLGDKNFSKEVLNQVLKKKLDKPFVKEDIDHIIGNRIRN